MKKNLDVRVCDTRKFILLSDIDYPVGDHVYTVPAGFVTDLASVPRALWSVFPPHHTKYAKPAVLHDWMYVTALQTKKYADNVFYDNLKAQGVGVFRRYVLYFAVKFFGKGNYK